MAFKVWVVQGKAANQEVDSVRVSNKIIYIGAHTIEKCFKGVERVTLYWDEEREMVGIKAANGENGFKLGVVKVNGRDNGVRTLRWERFATHYKLSYPKPVSRRIVEEGELWVFKP